jgi:hypothetical protein
MMLITSRNQTAKHWRAKALASGTQSMSPMAGGRVCPSTFPASLAPQDSSPTHKERLLRHQFRKRPRRGINLVLVSALRGRAVFVDEVAVPLGFHQADVAGFELAFPRFPSRRFRAGDLRSVWIE